LKRAGSIDPELGLRLCRETAHALEAVHEAGIVHRDIKPDNLFLVGPIGEPEHVKVLDFGMARMPDEIHDLEATSILGTAQYMAPEQILVEPVDARTDVYSLGVVLFRLVTGHLPFDAQNPGDLLRHQIFSPIPPPSWLCDDLPPGLEEVIIRATRKSPQNRYRSMREFGSALDAVVGFVSRPVEEQDFIGSLHASAPVFADDSSPLVTLDGSSVTDIYTPITERGLHAARVLAKDFGIYAQPDQP
jgi:serine/threonine-protein kinase